MLESVVQGAMRRLAPAFLVLMLAAPVHAAEDKAKAAAGQYVDIAPVALPIVDQGRLINFVFVTLRLNLGPGANAVSLRDKEPYFRDALVHTAWRRPFTVPGSYTKVDVPALKARMLDEAARIAGPRVVASVELIGEPQPKRVSGLPRPQGATPAPSRAPIP